tara:strand:+ start:25 stop:690 length:666 start_codon:yes stop_codon:yes gene_type:complete
MSNLWNSLCSKNNYVDFIVREKYNILQSWKELPILISHQYKVIWFKPARTGGTSLKDLIYMKYGFKEVGRIKILTDKEILDDYFKFIVVRNPYDRLVSGYKWGQVAELVEKCSFEDFVFNRILDKDGNFTDAHWMPQTVGLLDGKLMLDYVGRFEALNTSIKQIISKLSGRPFLETIPHRNSTKDAHKCYKKYYNADIKKYVRELYSMDFEIFKNREKYDV